MAVGELVTIAAYHEAGHAAVALDAGIAVEYAFVRAEAGEVNGAIDYRAGWRDRAPAETQIRIALAGGLATAIHTGAPLAEGRFYRGLWSAGGAAADLDDALRIAWPLAAAYPDVGHGGPTGRPIDSILLRSRDAAARTLAARWPFVERFAARLRERGRLDRGAIAPLWRDPEEMSATRRKN